MIAVVLVLSVLIGISLGLLGGGGSILTVPILTYAAGMTASAAIASSLFVVAVTSGAAVASHARAGRVRWRTGLVFGVAGMIGAYAGGHLAGSIPSSVLMALFGGMMLIASVAMLRNRRPALATRARDLSIGRVGLLGAAVGSVTGLIGAGGGFVVVPALVVLGGLSAESAIGTSLLVIAMSSTAGFVGHIGRDPIDWSLTLGVTAAAVIGSRIGGSLTGKLTPATLRRSFGTFVLVMAMVVLAKELT